MCNRKNRFNYCLVLFFAQIIFVAEVVAESFDSLFDEGMQKAQASISVENYSEALKPIERLRALMDADDDVLATERAWIYDFHRYVLYELGRKDEAYNVCETAIDDIGDQAYEWQYLADFNIVRRTLRACFNMLAWMGMEKATTIRELQTPINDIESAFAIIGVQEENSVVDDFKSTRAKIYLKAMSFDSRYASRAFNALSVFAGDRKFLGYDDDAIQKALVSEEYLRYTIPSIPEPYSLKKLPAALPVPASVLTESAGFVEDCQQGDMQSCDVLYSISLGKSKLEEYGISCGGRAANNNIDCVTLAQNKWLKKTPKAKKPPTKLVPNAASECHKGDMNACDLLHKGAPAGTGAAHYGYSCGGRFELLGSSCVDLLSE